PTANGRGVRPLDSHRRWVPRGRAAHQRLDCCARLHRKFRSWPRNRSEAHWAHRPAHRGRRRRIWTRAARPKNRQEMNVARLEDLADLYGQHIATPWQRTVAGAQRVIIVAYDKEGERVLRARKGEFETRTKAAGHDWHEVDLTNAFASWLAD